MDISIKASDGKVFNGSNFYDLEKRVSEYEVNLKKKQEEELANSQIAEKSFKEIQDMVSQLNAAVKEYNLSAGDNIKFTRDFKGELQVTKSIYTYDEFFRLMGL